MQKPRLDNEEALAYFYCSRTTSDARQQDVRAILLSLIRQLAAPLPSLPLKQPIISVFERETARGSLNAHLSVSETKSLLTELVEEHYQQVTIILDALDEVNNQSRLELLDFLTTLTYNPKTRVKAFLSSRNDSDVQSHLSKVQSLSVTSTENASDVKKFVSNELGRRLLNGRASQELKDRVSTYLEENAHGVFRWVTMQINTLCDPDLAIGEQDVEHLLSNLPVTLEDTYARILSEISHFAPPSRQAITRILKLMVCAETPLDAIQLVGALRALSGVDEHSWDEVKILKMGRSLIKLEDRDERLVFAHLSVREFLEKQPDFNIEECHALAAEACLRTFLDSNITECQFGQFNTYALHCIGKHSAMSGKLRHQNKLQELLQAFFTFDNSNDAFARWNQACVKYSFFREADPLQERRNCQSLPGSPLFMACVYGFDEFIDPLVAHSDRTLYLENSLARRPLEVATRFSNISTIELLYNATIRSHCKLSIRAANWLMAAATRKDISIWNFAAARVDDLPYRSAITYAVRNPEHADVVASLLDKIQDLSATILKGILYECASFEIFEMVMAKLPSLVFTQDLLVAAVRNRSLNPGLTKLILSRYPSVTVCESCLYCPFEMAYAEPDQELITVLLCHENRCEVTEELITLVIKLYAGQSVKCIEMLVKHSATGHVTEEWLIAAASNEHAGHALFQYLLERAAEQEITQGVLQSAMSNRRRAWTNLGILRSQSRCLPILDESIYAAARSWSMDAAILPLALDVDDPMRITAGFFEICAANKGSQEVVDIVRRARYTPIFQEVILSSLRNPNDAAYIAEFLLQVSGMKIEMSEDQLNELLAHHARLSHGIFDPQSPWIIHMLARHCSTLPVTENTLIAAMQEANTSGSTIELLVDQCKSVDQVLTDVVLNAALAFGNETFVSYFLSKRPNFPLREEQLKAAVHGGGTNNATLQLLLVQENRCPVSVSLLREAAKADNKPALELLLNECKDAEQFEIPKEIPKQQRKDGVSFATILAEISDNDYGRTRFSSLRTKRLESLLLKCRLSEEECSHLIEAATGQDDGRVVVQYLLDRFPRTMVTRRAVELAVSNENARVSLLSFLLDHYKGELDAELLLFAARNPYRGTDFVKLLLTKITVDESIEKGTLLAGLENPYCGRSILKLFLSRNPDIVVNEVVVDAASKNTVQNIVLLQLFLTMALSNSSMGLAEMVYRKLGSIVHGTRDSLFMAACYSDETVLRFLISQGVPINQTSGELGTALNVAVGAGNIQIIDILLAAGSDPDAPSKLYGTPLQMSTKSCNQDIVKTLARHGVKLDLPESLGRTALQLSMKNGGSEIATLLVSLGASREKQDLQGMNALHHATLYPSSSDCIKVLLRSGDPVEEEDSAGWTALHWAAKAGSVETVTLLLDAGFHKDRKDHAGRIPYQIAMFCGNVHLRPKLLPTEPLGLDNEVYRREHHVGYQCDACDLVSLRKTTPLLPT